MNIDNLLMELKNKLMEIYKNKLVELVLFGSYARNEHHENSDIDLLLVLSGEMIPGIEINRIIDVVYDMSLAYDVLLSVVPISENEYKKEESAFLINVRKEGRIVA
jgi:uncharacterized protein